MNAFSPRLLGYRDQFVGHKVAFARRRRPDRVRLVTLPNVERSCIHVGIDRDRAETHPARGPGDATGDFAAIGNQD
jgi:hypothetical protein